MEKSSLRLAIPDSIIPRFVIINLFSIAIKSLFYSLWRVRSRFRIRNVSLIKART